MVMFCTHYMRNAYLLNTPETYVVGAPFDRVRVEGVSHGTVVFAYDQLKKGGAVGLFMNRSDSSAINQMLGELNQAGFSVDGLEAKLAGLGAKPGASDPITQQMRQSRAYITSALQNFGIPPASIRERYSTGSGLSSVTVNLRTGRLVVWPASSAVKASIGQSKRMEELLPKVDEAESYDPQDPPKGDDPPEPDDERFWLRQR